MTENVQEFLTDKFDTGKNKKYVILPKGTKLQKFISYDDELPKKDEKVNVLKLNNDGYDKGIRVLKPKTVKSLNGMSNFVCTKLSDKLL